MLPLAHLEYGRTPKHGKATSDALVLERGVGKVLQISRFHARRERVKYVVRLLQPRRKIVTTIPDAIRLAMNVK
jgi:hypothetical protein